MTAQKPVPTSPMQHEPAAIIGLITAIVTAVIALLVAFGIDLTQQQQTAILGLVAALAPVIAAIAIRAKVYAPATTQALLNDAVLTGVAPDVAPPPPTHDPMNPPPPPMPDVPWRQAQQAQRRQ